MKSFSGYTLFHNMCGCSQTLEMPPFLVPRDITRDQQFCFLRPSITNSSLVRECTQRNAINNKSASQMGKGRKTCLTEIFGNILEIRQD